MAGSSPGPSMIGLRYRLVNGQGGGSMVGPGTAEEFLRILRDKYGERLAWVDLPDGRVVFENEEVGDVV